MWTTTKPCKIYRTARFERHCDTESGALGAYRSTNLSNCKVRTPLRLSLPSDRLTHLCGSIELQGSNAIATPATRNCRGNSNASIELQGSNAIATSPMKKCAAKLKKIYRTARFERHCDCHAVSLCGQAEKIYRTARFERHCDTTKLLSTVSLSTVSLSTVSLSTVSLSTVSLDLSNCKVRTPLRQYESGSLVPSEVARSIELQGSNAIATTPSRISDRCCIPPKKNATSMRQSCRIHA